MYTPSDTFNIPTNADTILKEFTNCVTATNPDFIIGIYLTGSISLNDFHPNKSDIDFLVLCKEPLTNELRFQIEKVHRKIEKRFKNSNLSGCYIIPENLNVHRSQTTKTLCYHEGKMKVSVFEMAPVTLYELKTTAITLWGTPARNLPVTVELKDVNVFLANNINTYWKSWVDERSSFLQRHLPIILFPRLTEWVVLGVARQLYSLQTGKIASKTEAGCYCLKHLPAKYHPIIQQAIEIRNDKRKHFPTINGSYYFRPSVKRFRETVACAGYIIEVFNEEYKKKENT